jgi:hypothetical protein
MAVPVLVELGIDQEVLDLINQERAKVGISPLNDNDDIDDAADRQAFDMATNNNFSEIGSDGSTIASRVEDTNYPFSNAGEVIAFGPMTPADVVAQWINDPVQRNTLLDPTFTDAALGSVANSDGIIYWVETFGGPNVTPAPVAPMTATADPLPVDPMVAVDPTPAPVDPMVAVDPTPAPVDLTGGVTTVGDPTDLQPSPDPVNNPVVDLNPIVMQMASVPQDPNNSNSDPIYSGHGNHSRRHQSHDRMSAPSDPMGSSDMMSAPARGMGRHH